MSPSVTIGFDPCIPYVVVQVSRAAALRRGDGSRPRGAFLAGRYRIRADADRAERMPESEVVVTKILSDAGHICGPSGKPHLSGVIPMRRILWPLLAGSEQPAVRQPCATGSDGGRNRVARRQRGSRVSGCEDLLRLNRFRVI